MGNDAHPWTECSNRGVCDRSTGECACYEPFEGHACQRNKCWNDCNGSGLCLPQRILADQAGYVYENPWDATKLWGCFCDIGYRGQTAAYGNVPILMTLLGDSAMKQAEIAVGEVFVIIALDNVGVSMVTTVMLVRK